MSRFRGKIEFEIAKAKGHATLKGIALLLSVAAIGTVLVLLETHIIRLP